MMTLLCHIFDVLIYVFLQPFIRQMLWTKIEWFFVCVNSPARAGYEAEEDETLNEMVDSTS